MILTKLEFIKMRSKQIKSSDPLNGRSFFVYSSLYLKSYFIRVAHEHGIGHKEFSIFPERPK